MPAEHSSGARRRLGGITKAGPPGARRLLVEAAWHYRHRPAVGVKLAARQSGVDPRVCALSARAQRRLHERFVRLAQERRRPPGVVAVACARELSGSLWEAAGMDQALNDISGPDVVGALRSIVEGPVRRFGVGLRGQFGQPAPRRWRPLQDCRPATHLRS